MSEIKDDPYMLGYNAGLDDSIGANKEIQTLFMQWKAGADAMRKEIERLRGELARTQKALIEMRKNG